MQTITPTRTLARPAVRADLARDALLVLAGSLVIAACAQVMIPTLPVPITMQTFGVMLVGAALGTRRGAAAATLYLLEGAAGMPVFAGLGAGAAVLVGPSAGYLLAFPAAAALSGWFAHRRTGWSTPRAAAGMTLATLMVLVSGTLWLSVLTPSAWTVGFWPFVPGGVIKVALAASLAPAAWDLVGRR